jgi:hypothetical protein
MFSSKSHLNCSWASDFKPNLRSPIVHGHSTYTSVPRWWNVEASSRKLATVRVYTNILYRQKESIRESITKQRFRQSAWYTWLSASAVSRCRALIRGIIKSRLDCRHVTLVSSDLDCSYWKHEAHTWRSHFGDYEIWFSVPGIHHLTSRALIHTSCADHRLRHTKTIHILKWKHTEKRCLRAFARSRQHCHEMMILEEFKSKYTDYLMPFDQLQRTITSPMMMSCGVITVRL